MLAYKLGETCGLQASIVTIVLGILVIAVIIGRSNKEPLPLEFVSKRCLVGTFTDLSRSPLGGQ